MGQKLVVGPMNRGLRNDVTPFVIDNDSFPVLINAYQWRGRVKRKRGTSLLGRLQRYVGTTDAGGNLVVTILPIPIATGTSWFIIGADIFVDPGTASPVTLITNSSGTATLNRTTGVLTVAGSIALTGVIYYPGLPVMGLEEFTSPLNAFPETIAFDTDYSYSILTAYPYTIFDVSFYKNPPSGTPVTYTQKSSWTPTTWNGQDYQQFYTVNYQGAMWATNGINVPFSVTNIGMQYKAIASVTVLTPTTASLNIVGHGLVIGDFVFVNEVQTTTGINFQTGYVTTVTDANNIVVTFPNATIVTNGTGGIAQYLTNRSDVTKDCLRWYDGDPVNSAVPPVFATGKGWVNFAPPLSQSNYSIADLPAAQYYLVGARMIVPFKDRILFLGPVVQTSAINSQVYLQDTIIYSQNGTPYYTASFTENTTVTSPTTVFNPLLVPTNQTATAPAYFEDQTGFGGFISAGIAQPMLSASNVGDVIIIGFPTIQTKLVYSGNDIVPFNLFIINSELGSACTFSTINMDRGAITYGDRGFVITGQSSTERIDLEIPDEVFQIRLLDNGQERMCSQRDYINEWIYLTYPVNIFANKFPTQTLQYNYRDNSWGVSHESYTTYGSFRKQSGFTWGTVGDEFSTWGVWNEPWNAGGSTLLQPDVIAGNQQGFVMVRNSGTNEGNSLTIQNISGSTITSPNHSLHLGDYIIISGVLGTLSSQVNGKVFSVSAPVDANAFNLNPPLTTGTYLGGGLIKRMYVPFIQTKQFPMSWDMGRKTRIGVQQYLLSTTDDSQITLLMYLSQDATTPYNSGPIVPTAGSCNSGLVYSTVLYTCTESANLGLTPPNTNLQMISEINSTETNAFSPQKQIWHRVNTSLIGDTVQLGFTLSDTQMRTLDELGQPISQFSEIELHSFVIDVTPSQMLS